MKTIHIIDSKEKVIEGSHFTFHEFFKPKFGGGIEFDMPEPLMLAMEILRNYFHLFWRITSVIRPKDTFGYHINGLAIDSEPFDISKWNECEEIFKEECLNYQKIRKSKLIVDLRDAGITGFGIEKGCIHLDVRSDHFHSKDSFGEYCIFFWEDDGTEYGNSQIIL